MASSVSATRRIVERRASMAGLSPISCTPSAACSTMCRWRESSCSNCCVFSRATAACAASSISACSSSAVKSPASLLMTSNAPNSSPLLAAQRHAQQRARLVAELAVDLAIDRRCVGGTAMRRGSPLCTTWPTTPESSGMRSSPPLTPRAGRPTSVWLGRSHRKMLARSALSSLVAASAILHQQRFHLVGLVPLAGDFEDRFQPLDAAALRVARR